MERTNKIVGGRDIPGSSKDIENALLLNFGFKSTGRRGKKRSQFSVKKAGRPYKTVHPERPRNMAANEVSNEAVVVFPYEDDGREGNTKIVEAVSCEDDEIIVPYPHLG